MGKSKNGSLVKRNGWYYFRRMENGKIFCRSCKTKVREEAEKAAAQFRTASDLPREVRLAAIQEFLKPKSSDPTVEEAFEVFRTHPRNIGVNPATMGFLHGHWTRLVNWLHGYHKEGSRGNCIGRHPEVKRVSQVTQAIASEFVEWAKEHAAPNTVNKYIATYRRVWNAAGAEKNPWKDFAKLSQPPHQRRALTQREIDRLIGTAQGEVKVIFAIGAYTGLRMSDCASVRWEDFESDLSVLRLKPHKTKDTSGVVVSLPVHHVLRGILERVKGRRRGFVTPFYANAPRWRLSDDVLAVFAKCGLSESAKTEGYSKRTPVVGFHSLRVSFVTSMCEAGAPLAMVKSIVGHVSEEITQMYYRADTERARAFIERLGGDGGRP